jgi:hypothetical protein
VAVVRQRHFPRIGLTGQEKAAPFLGPLIKEARRREGQGR